MNGVEKEQMKPQLPQVTLSHNEVVVNQNYLDDVLRELKDARQIIAAQKREIDIFQGMMDLGLRSPRYGQSQAMREDPIHLTTRSMRKQ